MNLECNKFSILGCYYWSNCRRGKVPMYRKIVHRKNNDDTKSSPSLHRRNCCPIHGNGIWLNSSTEIKSTRKSSKIFFDYDVRFSVASSEITITRLSLDIYATIHFPIDCPTAIPIAKLFSILNHPLVVFFPHIDGFILMIVYGFWKKKILSAAGHRTA